ncbi:uncharacterized protein N7459_005736 [Penicillium hispanicum]|uniref:uncharacterized protein n=1 Tax=Penicillium hispanicum TaxID=1080232 RepID=UPI00254114BA|nr:uncharacterized protein N7459_005736 [Penicillium hispanicum]KAJ5579751.1 hypothetical protein N7459_005736 [Penicillium hispanicum]
MAGYQIIRAAPLFLFHVARFYAFYRTMSDAGTSSKLNYRIRNDRDHLNQAALASPSTPLNVNVNININIPNGAEFGFPTNHGSDPALKG